MDMDRREKEAVRYLGYGRHAVDEKTGTLIRDSFKELDRTAKCRIVYRIFELEIPDDGTVKIGELEIRSKNLAKNMRGCQEAVMLGATLGIEVDMLLRRYSLMDMSKTVVLQACAAALLEEYLDDWQEEHRRAAEAEGCYLRPRFSPGYGDFDISHQEDVIRMLECAKKIGLTMTDRYMLTPSKSVTAVIGISKEEVPCHRKGCEECRKTDCIYRRQEREARRNPVYHERQNTF